MELRQLRYMVKVAETMNFTNASKQLFISQSTLSQQIMQLEAELNTLLFHRNGKHISLSEEGKVFYHYAKDCIQKSKDAVAALHDLKQLNSGELRIGVTFAFRSFIENVIINFHQTYPHIKIIVHFGSSNDMLDKLKNDQIDTLITFDMQPDENIFHSQYLFTSSTCFISAKENPVAQKKSISLKELSQYGLIVQNTDFNTWNFLQSITNEQGIDLKIIMEVNDNPTQIELIKKNIGYGIMADVTIKNEENLVGIPISGKKMNRKVSLITLKNIYLSKKVELFYEMLISG
ncbi:LysR family transcriptional regulator [Chryseobacterium sp. MYb264]|uniref:LysR family transcriptional regulator n=1 Tax=Chryseobacterium sp. MYb264 TaxID=2745153 RepID=UPI002E0DADC0|nr:LysR family transcriptional regulator [Chryseobacterium sp. MYb264]